MRYLFFLIGLCAANFAFTAEDIRDSRVGLLSYPRSGNTWLRYAIEYLTNRPTCEVRCFKPNETDLSKLYFPIGHNFDLGTDFSRVPVIKLHFIKNREVTPQKDYLILVLRNYKECIYRHTGSKSCAINAIQQTKNWYYQNIKIFDTWPKKRRLLLYYEELITNPQKVYEQLTCFMKEGDERVGPFLADLDHHRKNCISLYEDKENRSHTKGESAIYHSKKMPLLTRQKFDKAAKRALGSLYETYVGHYKEES